MVIKGEYKYAEKFQSNYSNGVVGGFRSSDELCINFYSESVTLPKAFDLNIDEISKTVKENGVRTSQITRTIVSQIVMNKDSAIKLRDWLNDNINKIDNPQSEDIHNPNDPSTVNISGLFN